MLQLTELKSLAPAGIALASLAIDHRHECDLSAQEEALVSQASDSRRREFATGRAVLHALMPGCGDILRTDTGAPAFAAGKVGSLAHDRCHALAAVTHIELFAAIGVDLEPCQPQLADELRDVVLRSDDDDVDPVSAFVMKEAAYKAWSGVGGWIVGPLEVQLTADRTTFTATFPPSPTSAPATPRSVRGIASIAEGYCVALALVPAQRRA
jgi:4'-phosphopantetheinyl transferase EntD